MRKKCFLHENWKVKIQNIPEEGLPGNIENSPIRDWIPASVPGAVHTDLLMAEVIDDPFYADNEKGLTWIHESDWVYQTEFDLPSEREENGELFLVFDGLDTIATIELNGNLVGDATNMFRKFRFPVKHLLKPKENTLQILFKSPTRIGNDLINKYGVLHAVRFEERVYLRKAQYSFGWDWGPSFPTVGIWRPVYLEYTDHAWIESVRFDTTEIKDSLASVAIKVLLGGDLKDNDMIECNLSYNDQKLIQSKTVSGSNQVEILMEIENPALWWPNGHGEQPLYELEVLLSSSGIKIDKSNQKVGIRRIELIHKENKKQVFYFRVNDKPVYMKGANWIPADSFLPRIQDSTYQTLLSKAKESGMNMLRIWGGGIYEQPIFYNICDELGLLIWQDFMFACSSYPENDFFMENVRQEAREKVADLQHHPSIALWCGNNENEWIWYRQGRGSYEKMPGFKIFHHELKEIVRNLDPLRPYWPTTPFGSEVDPNDKASGNRHSWDIWSYWVDYEDVTHDESLFVSEFGFQGPANINTLNSVLEKENRQVQDELFDFHNKQDEGNERLFKFLSGHLPVRTEWEDFIYLTQLNQGFALKTCLEHWRGRWPETAGSIIWQLNDCWPVTSWSLIDYNLLPKLAYFFVKCVFSDPAIYINKVENQLIIKITNESGNDLSAKLEYTFFSLSENVIIKKEKENIVLRNSARFQGHSVTLNDLPESENWIFITTLYNEQDYIIKRNYYSLRKWKHLKTSKSDISICKSGDKKITLTSGTVTLFADLYHKDASFSDRGFIMLPGEVRDLEIVSKGSQNIEVEDIRIFTLNDYLA